MGAVGVTLIFGAVVYFVIRPPHAFLLYFQSLWRSAFFPPRLADGPPAGDDDDERRKRQAAAAASPASQPNGDTSLAAPAAPPPTISLPSFTEDDTHDADEQQTTPKATKASPGFSLSGPEDDDNDDNFPLVTPPPPAPPTFTIAVPEMPAPQPQQPPGLGLMAPPPHPSPMAPPPRPGSSSSSGGGGGLTAPPRLPPLSRPQSSHAQSALSRSTLPIPNRGAPLPSSSSLSSSSSSLAPPTTHTNKPAPRVPPAQNARSRLVPLAPGHSPLDWARISSGPSADLRNLPPGTPYLRVSPSMLKRRDGRKGRDAWSAYGGRVYNVTPYVPFHPGGKGELLRGAGKDATKLFGEVHPWVNYETMLAACLVGVLVDEGEGHEDDKAGQDAAGGSSSSGNMEEMD